MSNKRTASHTHKPRRTHKHTRTHLHTQTHTHTHPHLCQLFGPFLSAVRPSLSAVSVSPLLTNGSRPGLARPISGWQSADWRKHTSSGGGWVTVVGFRPKIANSREIRARLASRNKIRPSIKNRPRVVFAFLSLHFERERSPANF